MTDQAETVRFFVFGPITTCLHSEKLKPLSGSSREEEGKHPEDEDSVLIEEKGFYKNFINLYFVELYFLRFDQVGLEGYLKATRVPGAKKYAAQLKALYSKLLG